MNTTNESSLRNSKIFVAGHRGLAGSAILRRLDREGCSQIVTRTHVELDLVDQKAVMSFFAEERPDYVFLAAAKVGGIVANSTHPAEFIQQNLAIQTNVIQAAYEVGVKRLLFLGSSCIYPRDCPQPIREDYMLTGPLEPTNRAYAVAKIAGIEMCWAFNRQYGCLPTCMVPTTATIYKLPMFYRHCCERCTRQSWRMSRKCRYGVQVLLDGSSSIPTTWQMPASFL